MREREREGGEGERERERERGRKGGRERETRAYGKTCARCPLIRTSSSGTCSARFYTGVMSE